MTYDIDTDLLSHETIDKAIRKAAEEISLQLVSRYEGDEAPSDYIEYVEETAYQQLLDGVRDTEVDSLSEWSGEQDFEERVEREMAAWE